MNVDQQLQRGATAFYALIMKKSRTKQTRFNQTATSTASSPTSAKNVDFNNSANSFRKLRADYQRTYKKHWEDIPELRAWIKPDPMDSSRAFCGNCQISLRAHRRDLVDHSLTERHIRNATEASTTTVFFSEQNSDNDVPVTPIEVSEIKSENLLAPADGLYFSGDDEPIDNVGVLANIDEPFDDKSALHEQLQLDDQSQSEQQILVIQTGGTIDKDYPKTVGGYAFEIGDAAVHRIFERASVVTPLQFRSICRKDSQELTMDDRFSVYQTIAVAPQLRILITHGTDTLLETASYISSFTDLASKTIVLTGSFKPETFRNSDADFNVGCALGALQTLSCPGVYVCMNGIVSKWENVERDPQTDRFVLKKNGYF